MEQAQGKARELLDELVERGGEPGPMVRAMARAPALLRGYLDLTRAMKRSHSEILLARQGTSSDPAIAVIVAFAQQVLAGPAEITDADVGRVHEHGYRDEQIAEVTGLVALQLLTGAFNLVAGIHARPEELSEITPDEGG
jgi:hypothetical protein